MKPSTNQCLGQQRLSSTGSADTQTATIPNGTSAILIAVEGNAARVTLTPAGDPTSSTGLVFQKDQQPWLLLVGQGIVFKAAGITGASVIQLAYLS